MKKVFTVISFATLALLGLAQPGNAQTSNDPAAKKILDAVSAKFKTINTPQAGFTYTLENAQGKALSTKKGTVVMKGSKYKVAMDGLEIYSDGKTSWSYDKSSNEVTVSNVSEGGSNMSPQRIFTNFYDKDFLYKLNGEKKQGAQTLQEIELTPTDKSKAFFKVYVYTNKQTLSLYSARFLEKSGSRSSYTINSLKSATGVTDADFTFNKASHPGVEVVDLR